MPLSRVPGSQVSPHFFLVASLQHVHECSVFLRRNGLWGVPEGLALRRDEKAKPMFRLKNVNVRNADILVDSHLLRWLLAQNIAEKALKEVALFFPRAVQELIEQRVSFGTRGNRGRPRDSSRNGC